VIAASLAKGLAAATTLRRHQARCTDTRRVTIRHERTPVKAVVTRASYRPLRPSHPAAARTRERVAA
jgi:hypothetical protein